MSQANQYFIIHEATARIHAKLAEMVVQGWKPILMTSSSAGNGEVRVIVCLEKPGA